MRVVQKVGSDIGIVRCGVISNVGCQFVKWHRVGVLACSAGVGEIDNRIVPADVIGVADARKAGIGRSS